MFVFCSWWWRWQGFRKNACFKLSESQLPSAILLRLFTKPMTVGSLRAYTFLCFAKVSHCLSWTMVIQMMGCWFQPKEAVHIRTKYSDTDSLPLGGNLLSNDSTFFLWIGWPGTPFGIRNAALWIVGQTNGSVWRST